MKTFIELSLNERINQKSNLQHEMPTAFRMHGVKWMYRNKNTRFPVLSSELTVK